MQHNELAKLSDSRHNQPFDFDQVDSNLGWKEPGEMPSAEETEQDQHLAFAAFMRVAKWCNKGEGRGSAPSVTAGRRLQYVLWLIEARPNYTLAALAADIGTTEQDLKNDGHRFRAAFGLKGLTTGSAVRQEREQRNRDGISLAE